MTVEPELAQVVTSPRGPHAVLALSANLAGSGWAAALGLAMVPLYLGLIGMEAYGLVGFFASLTTMLQVFDFGMSPTINRELARYSVQPEKAGEARDFVRTLELAYWGLAIVLGLVVALLAPWIATHWLRATQLTVPTLETALLSMAAVTLLQWPISLYQGGLIGLQRQVLFNGLWIAFTTLRHVGALIVLSLYPSVITFFAWQALASALYVCALAVALWRCLPPAAATPRFLLARLISVGRFAAGVSAMTITALILTQFDKIVLSTVLDLTHFGYYTLANTIAGSLGMLVGPVFNVDFPRFAGLVQLERRAELNLAYHRSAQVIAALVLPVAMILVLFAEPIVLAWTQDPIVAANVAGIARILTIGSALNTLMTAATALQLAYGWTRLSVVMNLVLIVVFLPLTVIIGQTYGGQGVAGIWVAINIIYMVVSIPLTHQRLMGGELFQWIRVDVGRAFVVCSAIGILSAFGIARLTPGIAQISAIALVALAAVAASAWVAPQTRQLLAGVLTRFRS